MAFGEHDRAHKKHHEEQPTETPTVVEVPAEPKAHKVQVKHVSARTERPKVDVNESLRAIYQDDDGAMPDMTKIEHRKSKGWLMATVALVVLGLLGGTAYIGYLVFAPYLLNSNAKLEVTITAPETIGSFEETTIKLAYENVGRGPVGSGELRLNAPQEFRITSADPLPMTEPATWAIASLAPGEKGQITIKGYFVAEGGTHAFFQSVVRYSPQGMSKEYEDIATKTVSVSGSKLALSMDIPTETVAGEKTTFTYRVKNNADLRIENIVLTSNVPKSFIISESKPKAEADGSWKIGTLDHEQEAKVTITGTFSANHEDNENIGGSVFVKKDSFSALQAEAVSPIRVASSDFVLRTIVNGSAENQTVDFGGRLRVSSIFKNNGNRTMKDITLVLTLDSAPDALIDWKKFDEETEADKTFVRKGETITLNKKLYPGFAELLPGAEGSLAWNIPLVQNAIVGAKEYRVNVAGKATVGMIGNSKVTKMVQTTPFTITPDTDLKISAGAYYFNEDDVPIGSGPLPPVVGEETKYIIAWKVMNSVHDVKDLQVKTQLAEGVSWTGKTASEGGSISYDETTRTVSWRIDKLAASTPSISAQFEVALVPKTSHLDSFAPLTTGATLTSVDAVTGSTLTRTTDPDSTELPMDVAARGKGLVIKAE